MRLGQRWDEARRGGDRKEEGCWLHDLMGGERDMACGLHG
jgi:hypothetical protein